VFKFTLHAAKDTDGDRPIPGTPLAQSFEVGDMVLREAQVLAQLHPEAYISVRVEYREA